MFVAVDGQPIEPGCIYLPAPDRHLIVGRKTVRLGAGARENMTRPAIDPLFRSAALAFGPRTIGVVLSGYLNDGAAGLVAIKARGGIAIAQHPLDAEVADMPEAALAAVEGVATLGQDELAAALIKMASQEAPAVEPGPDASLDLEVRIALGARLGSAELEAIAEPSALTCPHCHGVLSEVKAVGPLRFRCQTGHAYTAEAALAGQQAEVDDALLIALRVMEERVTLVSRMAREARHDRRAALAEVYERRADEYSGYARTLREAASRSLPPLETAAE
ncbi:MAG: chemotaxis protein CheB [Caulobacteraceae bacterium]